MRRLSFEIQSPWIFNYPANQARFYTEECGVVVRVFLAVSHARWNMIKEFWLCHFLWKIIIIFTILLTYILICAILLSFSELKKGICDHFTYSLRCEHYVIQFKQIFEPVLAKILWQLQPWKSYVFLNLFMSLTPAMLSGSENNVSRRYPRASSRNVNRLCK